MNRKSFAEHRWREYTVLTVNVTVTVKVSTASNSKIIIINNKKNTEDPADKDAGKDAWQYWSRFHQKDYALSKLRCKSEGSVRKAPMDAHRLELN